MYVLNCCVLLLLIFIIIYVCSLKTIQMHLVSFPQTSVFCLFVFCVAKTSEASKILTRCMMCVELRFASQQVAVSEDL